MDGVTRNCLPRSRDQKLLETSITKLTEDISTLTMAVAELQQWLEPPPSDAMRKRQMSKQSLMPGRRKLQLRRL